MKLIYCFLAHTRSQVQVNPMLEKVGGYHILFPKDEEHPNFIFAEMYTNDYAAVRFARVCDIALI